MSLTYFNGGTILRSEFNGDDLKRIYFNGGIVFERIVGPVISDISATPSSIDDDVTSQLNVDATDPLGGTLTYNWTTVDGGSFSDPAMQNPVFTPPEVVGTQVITLTCWVTNEDTTEIDQVDVTVTQANHTHCSVTNYTQSLVTATNGITIGLRVESVAVHGHTLYRQMRFYAESGGSGGWAAGAILLDFDNQVASGSSIVSVSGFNYGYAISGGKIYAISDSIANTGNLVTVGECGLSGTAASAGSGNEIHLETSGGTFRSRYFAGGAGNNVATKYFTPYQQEYPGPV